MRIPYILPLLLLAGCGSVSIVPPVVDRTKVSPQQYAQDEADCTRQGQQTSFSAGNPITNCMKARGYTILVPN